MRSVIARRSRRLSEWPPRSATRSSPPLLRRPQRRSASAARSGRSVRTATTASSTIRPRCAPVSRLASSATRACSSTRSCRAGLECSAPMRRARFRTHRGGDSDRLQRRLELFHRHRTPLQHRASSERTSVSNRGSDHSSMCSMLISRLSLPLSAVRPRRLLLHSPGQPRSASPGQGRFSRAGQHHRVSFRSALPESDMPVRASVEGRSDDDEGNERRERTTGGCGPTEGSAAGDSGGQGGHTDDSLAQQRVVVQQKSYTRFYLRFNFSIASSSSSARLMIISCLEFDLDRVAHACSRSRRT